jgi:urea transporter
MYALTFIYLVLSIVVYAIAAVGQVRENKWEATTVGFVITVWGLVCLYGLIKGMI